MTEVTRKINFVRSMLKENNLAALHLRGVDWFSWITAGGSSVVIMTAEVGIAEVFITENEAWILTNKIESVRLQAEEIPAEFRISSFPWQDNKATSSFIKEKIGEGKICSDRPMADELILPQKLQIYKMQMQAEEIVRYRDLGRKAAEAMTEALAQAKPEWTENELAGAGAKALWSRGLEPTLILVAGTERGKIYRHPITKSVSLGESAMMVFCARAHGLYANLTRFIYFRDQTPEEKHRFAKLLEIESTAFKNTVPGNSLSKIYQSLADAYESHGLADEVNFHHQGGPTGYLSREMIAKPDSDLIITPYMAFAWNPSLPGAKVEDTVLMTEKGMEVLTVDPQWPAIEINGLKRANVWIRK